MRRKDLRRTGRAAGGRDRALEELDAIRAPLFEELRRRSRDPDYYRGRAAHACCTRELNQMRISPLEAEAIARAFRRDRRLRAHLPAVLDRLRSELPRLRDDGERQSFDCPLLEKGRCLVHGHAKPIGCTAWHPPRAGEEVEWTRAAWTAFAARDRLNDRVQGPDWKLRVIPLWLRRVFSRELAAGAPPARLARERAP